jgi:tyrosine-protein kinase Etk/Wzc
MEQNFSPGNLPLLEGENLDLKRYLSLYISNWYWFAAALFISVTLAYSINRYSQKIFSVSSTLLIKDDQLGKINNSAASVIPGGDIFRSQQNLNNEIGILKSFTLNYMVMKELSDFRIVYVKSGRRGIVESRMYKTSPFKVLFPSVEKEPTDKKVGITILNEHKYNIEIIGESNIVKEMNFGDRFTEAGFDFSVIKCDSSRSIYKDGESNKYFFYFLDEGNLAAVYRNKLVVVPINENASLVTLSVTGPVARQETDYLNKLMEVYLKYGLDNKNQTADSTIKFIDGQLSLISDSLSVAEKNLERFRRENNFLDLSREGTIVQNRLEKFENEKSSFELQMQYYNYLSESLKNTASIIIPPSVMGITDQGLMRLVNQLADLQKEKELLEFNIEGDQSAIELINRQTEETRKALVENVKKGISGLTQILDEKNKNISETEIEINKLPTMEREFIIYQRKFDLNNTVYTYLLEKRSESGIARASNVFDNRIIDTASNYSSVLIKPKTKKNLTYAIILGLILPMIVLTVIDFFNDTVIDKKDVTRKTKVPVLGYISHSDSKAGIAVIEKPGSSLSESFRSVRTSLKYFIKENEKTVIAVSSTISSEGKTFISVNLAAIMAMLGKKVLLIGLDLRKPRINRVFGFEESQGMSTYLSGNCSFDEIIMKTAVNNLFYVPSGPVPPNPAELIDTEDMKLFMEKAKQDFDFIIIDTPPVAIVTDALLLAEYVNINLFIVRQRFSSYNTLDLIEQLYNGGELKNMAILINDISLNGYYGYGMRYGYGQGYGYSYGSNYYSKGYYSRYDKTDNAKGYYIED